MDDPWIIDNSPIAAEKLHAIGLITFRWNSCEFSLRIVLILLLGNGVENGWQESHGDGARQVSEKIKKMILASANSSDVKESILYALELYDVNRLNRNQFTHFLPDGDKSGTVFRNSKNQSFQQIFKQPVVDSDIQTIRAVADNINELLTYLVRLLNYFSTRFYSSILAPEPSLPEKPPLPQRTWKYLPHPNTPKSKPQR